MIWIKCINAEDSESCSENIIHGDSLTLEGDILRIDFHDSYEKRGGNRKRNYITLIIDETDSTGLDIFDSSIRLCAPFPSYELWNNIYPFIYNSLISIDKYVDICSFGNIL